MTRVKVLLIHPADPLGNKIGGIETFIKNFIKFAPSDFDVELVGVTCDRDARPVGRWQRIAVGGREISFLPLLYVEDENARTKIPVSLKFTLSLFRHRKLLSLEDRILEYHRIEPCLALAGAGGRKVLFVHNNMKDWLFSAHSEVKWRRLPWLYFQMEKRLIGSMAKVFAVREDMVWFYQDRYPRLADKVSFLPTWVDEERFFPLEDTAGAERKKGFLARRNLAADSKLVLFAGRLEGQKDPLLLIETFRHVQRRLPESVLLIAGTGSFMSAMEERAKGHGLEAKTCFLGPLPQDEVAEVMRISDVFLLTSAFEGMPRSLLEAIACGLPAVSTDVGEVGRVIREDVSGLVCSSRDPADIGDAVLRVLNGKRSSRENCSAAIKDYTARRVLAGVYDFYYKLGAKQ